MARYIDLDKAIERLKASPAFPNFGTDGYFLLDVVVDLLKQQPTADVDQLKATIDRLERENAEMLVSATTDIPITMETLFKVRTEHPIFKAIKSEVAREIFEEIEKHLIFNTYGIATISEETFAQLEKKYTKGE